MNRIGSLDGDTKAMARHTFDLDTYLSMNSRFKSFVYDHREIRYIANSLGIAPDRLRTELRKLGYCLIRNNHGRMLLEEKM